MNGFTHTSKGILPNNENNRDTLQNLRNPEFWAENFVQNPEGVHRKFWDPHFSNAVALLELGIMILVMHS